MVIKMLINNILISVLIPVYNVEKYIAAALNSICNQAYRNLQIIVIDDCSTDNTYQIAKKIAESDSRILLLKNEKNSKIVKTLNYGLEFATGDFIARMDGDDISSPERLEKQLKFLLENPEYSLVGSHVYTIDEYDNVIGKLKLPVGDNKLNKVITYSSPVLHIWLARSSVYSSLKGYREIPGAEDYDFLLRMSTEGFKFTNLDSYEYSVRVRDGNTTSTIGFNQRLMSNYVIDLYYSRLKNNMDEFSTDSVNVYLAKYAKHKLNFDKSNKYLREAFKYKAEKKYLKMFFLVFLTVVTSKYQYNYLKNRFLFKIYS